MANFEEVVLKMFKNYMEWAVGEIGVRGCEETTWMNPSYPSYEDKSTDCRVQLVVHNQDYCQIR